ncbi:CaiB/BaiF CoA transferase family protein [Alcaligenes endophyticus]|uniref:CoA transferase n=1 Tax=Alcaligenes endophyticus TaxID=1929088 RepID=A0ABT8EHF4_9BURK|nr:CoA transferase [Alcaligenes endophyticus]MCX5592077.1 CoA transferase [Alcaligenes endophyticus]MDN4120724.1 CoA transferase [Alcaligenes endophyticus]
MFDRQFIDSLPVYDRSEASELPLKGMLVLDITHYIAGPLASMLLADLGATVIKVEAPGGDRFRAYPPHDTSAPEEGAAYLWANRNKLGLELNLKSEQGQQVISRLLTKADVLIENFAHGVMGRLGFGYEQVHALNPKLVYCSVSAYGSQGKFAERPGFDSVVQAESGFVAMNGYADRPGVRTASSVMDIGTAMLASNGILAALYARQATGEGRHVEVSLYGSALLMNGYATMQTLCSGQNMERYANTSPDSCPTGVFDCQDASFFLHCGNNEIAKRLFSEVLARPDLAENPAYQTAAGRLADRESIFVILKEAFATMSWAELKHALENARVPAGQVRDLKTALLSSETEQLAAVERVPHKTLGWVPNVRTPIFFDGSIGNAASAAPVRGQDSEAVLRDIAGFSEEEIQAIVQSGHVRSA